MGRILGIDYGKVRTGLALSDPMHIIASPYKTISFSGMSDAVDQILSETEANEVERIVVGLPLSMSGKNSLQTIEVMKFIEELKSKTSIPVVEIDERLTSVEAKRMLHEMGIKTGHNKSQVDKTAAAIILKTYLDSKR